MPRRFLLLPLILALAAAGAAEAQYGGGMGAGMGGGMSGGEVEAFGSASISLVRRQGRTLDRSS